MDVKIDIKTFDFTRFNHQVQKTQTAGKLLNYYGDLIQRIEYAIAKESVVKEIPRRMSDVPVFRNLVSNKTYTNVFNIKLNNIHKLAEEFQNGSVYLEKLTMSNTSKWMKKHFKDEIKFFASTYKEIVIRSYFDLRDKNVPIKYDIVFNFNGVNPDNQVKFNEINQLTRKQIGEENIMDALQRFINVTSNEDIKVVSKAQLLDLIEEEISTKETTDEPTNVVGYHVAPSKLDSIIPKEGIKKMPKEIYSRLGKKGISPVRNHFWLDLKYAEWFKNFNEEDGYNPQNMTIWEVDLTGYNLIKDNEASDMNQWSSRFSKGEDGQAVYVETNIPPDRIIDTVSESRRITKAGLLNLIKEEVQPLMELHADDAFRKWTEIVPRMITNTTLAIEGKKYHPNLIAKQLPAIPNMKPEIQYQISKDYPRKFNPFSFEQHIVNQKIMDVTEKMRKHGAYSIDASATSPSSYFWLKQQRFRLSQHFASQHGKEADTTYRHRHDPQEMKGFDVLIQWNTDVDDVVKQIVKAVGA